MAKNAEYKNRTKVKISNNMSNEFKKGGNSLSIKKNNNIDLHGKNDIHLVSVTNNLNKTSTIKKCISITLGVASIFSGIIYFAISGELVQFLFGSLFSAGIGFALVLFNYID